MAKMDAIKALEIYKRAGQQAEKLSAYYDYCKNLELAKTFQFPTLRQKEYIAVNSSQLAMTYSCIHNCYFLGYS